MKEVSKEQFKKDIEGKKINFHEDFNKGSRLWLCESCGFPVLFIGLSDGVSCECKSCDPKVYKLEELEDFIFKLQEIYFINNLKKK